MKQFVKELKQRMRRVIASDQAIGVNRRPVKDPKSVPVIPRDRPVYQYLKREGLLDRYLGKRFFEVGPKHGRDSLLLAELHPSELVLIDLPSKSQLVKQWLPEVQAKCPTTYLEANLLYLPPEQFATLGTFDLIFCLGVLYHNTEQLRMLKKLYDLSAIDGMIVIESSTTRNDKLRDLNVVEVCWPEPFGNAGTVTHHPSRLAIKSWMEMVGFENVQLLPVFDKNMSRDRAALIGYKTPESATHDTRFRLDGNRNFRVGEAT